jgi:hypothetical protein
LEDVKTIILRLKDLEKSSSGNFQDVISKNGISKVKNTLELYDSGLKYGFSEKELSSILSSLVSLKEEEDVTQEAVLPPVEAMSENDILDFSKCVLDWLGEDELFLSPFEVCQFYNRTPNTTLRTRLCKYFNSKALSSVRVKNSNKYTKTYQTRYRIPLEEEIFSDIEEILSAVEEDVYSPSFFSAYDFLDGTECESYLIDQEGVRLNIVLNLSLVSAFENFNTKMDYYVKKEDLYKGSPRNLFLLNRSLEGVFHTTSISSLCKELIAPLEMSPSVVKEISDAVRQDIKNIKVKTMWESQKETSLSFKAQGRVYLLAYMLIMYRAGDLKDLEL